ncbi:MAG TPA: glycosyltransferase family 39 protein [Aggregatilineales bacterium]|nr:glycosyltransferase family 39 protein [Aggregatilineales bacterium]
MKNRVSIETNRITLRDALPVTLILLLLMAGTLITGLNDESLWGDEGWSVHFTDGDTLRDSVIAVSEDRHPPLYFAALHLWREVAGDDEVSMRMLAVYAALMAAACMFRLGKILYGSQAGLPALMMFVLMDKFVVFAQEVRHYSWFVMWTVAASWALVRWLKNPYPHPYPYPRSGFILVATLIGGLYTHSLMVVVWMVHSLYAAGYLFFSGNWRRLTHLMLLYVFALIGFAPWLMVSIYQYTSRGGITPSMPLEWRSVEILAPQFLGKPVTLTAGLLLLGLLSPVLRVAPGWKNTESRPKASSVMLPALLLLIPVLLVLILTGDKVTLLNDRNLSMMLPAIALLIGLGITAFTGFSRVALLTFLLVNGILTTDIGMHNPPLRPISRYIAAHQVDSQPIIRDVGGTDAAFAYHLRQELESAQIESVPGVSIYEMDLLREEDPTFEPLAFLRFGALQDVDGFWYVQWGDSRQYRDAFLAWGFAHTATASDVHFGHPIYIYRYDLASISDENRAIYGDETMQLHRVTAPDRANPGDTITVHLWWSAAQPVPESYTVSVFVLDQSGRLVAQHDGLPQYGRESTSTWLPQTLYYDAHRIQIPGNLPPDVYQIGVKVYNGNVILRTENHEEYLNAGTLHLDSEYMVSDK